MPADTVKIFIGNVNQDTTPEQIQPLFEKYGEVVECDVLGNYGFVHMKDKNEANRAIAQLDNYSMNGSNLRVELANSTGKRREGGGGGKFMDRRGMNMGRGRGYGPPAFDRYGPPMPPRPHPMDRFDPYYRQAMEREYYARERGFPARDPYGMPPSDPYHRDPYMDRVGGGRGPPPDFYNDRRDQSGGDGESYIKTTKIFIGNLNEGVTADQIQSLFEEYGKVLDCIKMENKNFGFVHMVKRTCAYRAIEALDGQMLEGQKMHVMLSRAKPDKEGPPMGGPPMGGHPMGGPPMGAGMGRGMHGSMGGGHPGHGQGGGKGPDFMNMFQFYLAKEVAKNNSPGSYGGPGFGRGASANGGFSRPGQGGDAGYGGYSSRAGNGIADKSISSFADDPVFF